MSSAESALALAHRVRRGEISARSVVKEALAACCEVNPRINACTAIIHERALHEAAAVDERIAAGKDPGLLAGVPYAVKNLFDVAGLTTLAGSRIDAENPPATRDATLIERLQSAGACLVATTNMDEYAYGFSTENHHYGPTRNPRDPARIAGGSSGGSAALVAAGAVPFSLGSDTNGSIRVPASLCGIYGLKPTYGRLSRAGTKPFVGSLDHAGPFARSADDLEVLMRVLDGADARDPVSRVGESAVSGVFSLKRTRCSLLGGYFERWSSPEASRAVEQVSEALGGCGKIEIASAEEARGAAYIITVVEGASVHLANLKKRPLDFDPLTRDRFLAGALTPAAYYVQAQKFRRFFQEEMRRVFAECDVLIAPSTPISAPLIGETLADFHGEQMVARHNLGLYTQPFSFVGLPALSVPVQPRDSLPVGVMLVGAPFSESLLLSVARFLEKAGVVSTDFAPQKSTVS